MVDRAVVFLSAVHHQCHLVACSMCTGVPLPDLAKSLWLAVGAESNLKVLLFLLLALQGNRVLFNPGVLRKGLRVFGSCLSHFGDLLLHFMASRGE